MTPQNGNFLKMETSSKWKLPQNENFLKMKTSSK